MCDEALEYELNQYLQARSYMCTYTQRTQLRTHCR